MGLFPKIFIFGAIHLPVILMLALE